MNESSKAIKSGIWYTISNMFVNGIGFILTPVFTRIMTKEEFGNFSNFQVCTLLTVIVTSLNLHASIGRAIKDFDKDKEQYLLSMSVFSFIFTFLCWGIVICFNDFFCSVYKMDMNYVNAMFLYLLFYPIIVLFQSFECFRYNYKSNAIISVLNASLTSVMSVGLALLMDDHVLGRVIGMVVPVAALGGVLFLRIYIKGKHIRIVYLKYALPIVIPYIPHLLSIYLLTNLDRIMIRDICGKETMALYSLAYTCAMAVVLFFNAANEAFAPWLIDKIFLKKYDEVRVHSFQYIVVFAGLSLGITLVMPEILAVMGPPEYFEARYVMPPVTAGCFLQFVYTLYVNVEQYEKKTVGMACASCLTVLLNYFLNSIFINKYGYIAAAYTTYICYFVLLIVHMQLVTHIGHKNLYNNIAILSFSVFSSLTIMSIRFIMDYNVLRFSFICLYFVVFCIFALKKKNQISKLLTILRSSK